MSFSQGALSQTQRPVAGVAALAAAVVVAALAAQVLPAAESFERSTLRALRIGVTAAWLLLTAYALFGAARAVVARRFAVSREPSWRLALVLTALIVPRFREDLGMGTVGAFWLVVLLVYGASGTRELLGARALRPYWLASALLIAPWGLVPGVPVWP